MPSLLRPTIDARIEIARTLPAQWYVDPAALAVEAAAIFARSWHLAGRAIDVAATGQHFAAQIAGEPVVVVRDGERLRALSNVCRHRAAPVAVGSGTRRTLQCAYHGWTYGLDGKLVAAPGMDAAQCVDSPSLCLPELRAETRGPFVFVCLDEAAPPLGAFLDPLLARAAHLPLDVLRPVERREWTVACNWKVYVDNFLEGYHIPLVHPSLYRELDHDAYRTDLYPLASVQVGPLREADARTRLRYDHPPVEDTFFGWMFPTFMLNVYPDNLSTNVVLPVGVDRTRVISEWWFPDGTALETVRRAVALSDEVQREDAAICEAVQRGLSSRLVTRGPYSARWETGVHLFHRLLAERLAESRWQGCA